MNILVLNCGSSSLKYQLINMDSTEVLAKGLVDRIAFDQSVIIHEKNNNQGNFDETEINEVIDTHEKAVRMVLDLLTDQEKRVIKSLDEIHSVGHRVVHGGEKFKDSVIINDEVLNSIKECIPLAPLHNPANITGIEACQKLMPDKKQVAVFDTAFHSTMPPQAYFYAIAMKYYEQYKIRRYGFHGTSHMYVARKAAEMLGKKFEDVNLITCHLGNGASICAIDHGKSVDTSMGFTPLEGLVMGTRSGDIDPAIIPFLCEKEGLTAKEVETILNKESGLKGFSGISNDMRDIWAKEKEGDPHAKLTIDLVSHRLKKYISAYMGILGGADAIVFTGGLGIWAHYVRERALKNLDVFGIEIDKDKNENHKVDISKDNSKVKIYIIKTNEELVIAEETKKLT